MGGNPQPHESANERATVSAGPLHERRHSHEHLIAHTYTVEEAADVLGISRAAAYAAIHSGELPSIHIAGTYRVPKKPLHRMLGEDWPTEAVTPGEVGT